ncbi:phosphoglycolate phosphatase [Anaeroplasma bactoclasticum]|jgi:phosphoglycolate phosphatase|uniref:Phosphoglycolate phosphatase n=1 Tax=Anaeroplasma bactoclasticum TaxID=2088 RepID=A0A397RYC5_9MOLU|nr:HAD family hydrolase [Anaeroplasma bactoclasticum]RIA78282.1 phosphoglycolate phosphatase [Anaeroplasma bactoclasticum]
MYKDIFLDFNGTIIDDLDLCVELLNVFLKEQGKKELSVDEYKHVFKFPIKQYYIDAGIDFNIESYESLAIRFIKEYQPRSMHCGLFPHLVDTVKKLKEMGIRVYILSASEQNNLLEQTNTYGITQYFDAVLGINNIHAASKVDRAINFMKDNGINPKETLFVGDTLHDKEVADAIGVNCVLVSCGHQAEDILEKSGCKVIPSVSDIFTIL